MKFYLISLFPEMFTGILESSMLWKAQDKGLVEYQCINLRQFGRGPRLQVDDTPYGGGDGMLLQLPPLVEAIESIKLHSPQKKIRVILPTPRGQTFLQSDAKRLAAAEEDIIMVCPRYEGYDERLVSWVDEQFCIGNYILTGGELPAMVMLDAVVRLIPGVLGGESSSQIESFQVDDQAIEYPQYTRPEEFRGLSVPKVLLGGHHSEISAWRAQNSQKAEL